jgi:release factor glutamine methyltransferase
MTAPQLGERHARMSSESWTLGRLLVWTTEFLKDKKSETPRLDAEVLLAHVVGCPRIQLYTRYDELATDDARGKYKQLVLRRIEGCPVAYLVGYKEFYNLRFAVSPAVLVPRPETEILVLEAIRLAKPLAAPKVLDVGTGSGAIAVTLSKHLPHARVSAVDISSAALEVAQRNAQTHGVFDRIQFVLGDLLGEFRDDERFDVIVSNPPYVATEAMARLPETVARFEPHQALDGGPQGLAVIERLVKAAKDHLVPGGHLLIEIGADQGNLVAALTDRLGGYEKVTILPDHAGLPRVLRAKLAT